MLAITEAMRNAGLMEHLWEIKDPRQATRDQITAVHHPTYVDSLQQAMAKAPTVLDPAPTYVTPHSFGCALDAAGAGINMVDTLLDGRAKSGFALIRPPGHHAIPSGAMGFCLISNIAVASRHAQTRGVNRVFIIDFDVHHGNGTQDVFYADSSVFFLSIHQAGIYPGSGAGDEIGTKEGHGHTLNVPLPAGAGDRTMQTVFSELVRPAAERFKPEMIMVSAGFDAHLRDPLAGLQCTCVGYHTFTNMLDTLANDLCNGRIAFFLEGGYNLHALAESVVNVFYALLDMSPVHELETVPIPEPDVTVLISNLKAMHNL